MNFAKSLLQKKTTEFDEKPSGWRQGFDKIDVNLNFEKKLELADEFLKYSPAIENLICLLGLKVWEDPQFKRCHRRQKVFDC